MTRLGGYFRARLHRRIFAWFGLTILITVISVSVLMALLSPFGTTRWRDTLERAETFAGGRFAAVWDDPAAREELAAAIARELDVDLTVVDDRGRVLAQHGRPCHRAWLDAPIRRDGVRLGQVRICSDREGRGGGGWRAALGLLVAGVVIWAASGKIARRLSRPMDELARVARALGEGDLTARARLGPHVEQDARVLGEAVNEMADRIARQIADQRELLAAVSHELRTPLGHLRLLIELARAGDGSGAKLDELDREVVELDALVGQLLAHSKLDFGALNLSSLDPVDAAKRALERAALPADLLMVEGAPPLVSADATLIARALANLIENARKHAGGATRLRVAVEGRDVAFEVQDRGPGLTAGDEERIFAPFYRSTTAGPKDPDSISLGLGLALVRRIADAHQGRAYARTLPQGGAAVGFRIRSAPDFRTA